MVRLPAVELTEEESQECESMLRSLTRADGGEYLIREEVADSFTRSIVALCLMGRAERFVLLAQSQPKFADEACSAGAKACSVFPISIYFYDFACVLKELRRWEESKVMFQEFLRRQESEQLGPVEQATLNQRDVAAAVRDAREQVS